MMKRILLAAALLACLFVLCACSGSNGNSGTRYDVVTDKGVQATQNVFGDNGFDTRITAAPYISPVPEQTVAVIDWVTEITPAPTMISEYAGATPVALDPIDRPTPTPLPALSFDYVTYDATNVHLSFQAPAGWMADDSAAGVYTLTNPDTSVDYLAQLSISVTPLSSNMSKNQLEAELNSVLQSLRPTFYTFSTKRAAERKLLDQDGWYNDFDATLSNGTQIKGRVQVTCVDRKLYVLTMVTPAGYFESYKDGLSAHFRNSVTITR